ncbi:hypothetical protein BR63_01660 [Thermanaerosceptrum fracticalcis]|uniref:FG-GAP repeat protein n=1 Tax=Thermanaerosceptrum fracticalcis TaxID=1712410 RepID=A0A7G6DZ84_THEFR|nr:VCBS repeat-containing protein [Thermanaerosceptrum fracticalcis]QNB45138.1 hypothetical protein BR63_01660 [Thermanaerosceptrum fracticalcis]
MDKQGKLEKDLIKYVHNTVPRQEIVCISADLVLDSRYRDIFKEYTFDVPFFLTEDCAAVHCTPLEGTERILLLGKEPTVHRGMYNVSLGIFKSFLFTIHCATKTIELTKELFIPVSCSLALGQAVTPRFEAQVYLTYSSCILEGESRNAWFFGQQPGEQFAFAMALGDAHPFVCVGSPSARVGACHDAGKITVFSIPDGVKLYEVSGTAQDDDFGFALDTGYDLNGDGWDDILVGAPSAKIGSAARAGYVRVLSGKDGTTLLTINHTEEEAQFGWAVSWAGDLDGDGVPDFLVAAPQASPEGKINAGSVFVYSGASGSLLYRLDGQNPGDAFGYALTTIGDVDGDGIPDLAIGAPLASPSGLYQAGEIYVYSGAAGSLIYKIEGTEFNAGLGFSLKALPDINGDGIPEILAGAPGSSPGGRSEAGSAYIFSSLDGSQLLHFAGPVSGEEVGIAVTPVGDLDNDGQPDLALGAPSASPHNKRFAGKVYLISSRTGQILQVLEGQESWNQFGWSVAGSSLLNANSILFIGSPGNDALYMYQGKRHIMRCEMHLCITLSVLQKREILIPAML